MIDARLSKAATSGSRLLIFHLPSNFCDIQNYVGQNILEVLTNQGSRQNCAIFSVDNDDHGYMTTKCFIALYFDYHKISRTDHIVTVSYQKLYYFISSIGFKYHEDGTRILFWMRLQVEVLFCMIHWNYHIL